MKIDIKEENPIVTPTEIPQGRLQKPEPKKKKGAFGCSTSQPTNQASGDKAKKKCEIF